MGCHGWGAVIRNITNVSDSSIQTRQKSYNRNSGREMRLANEILPFSENKNARIACIFSTYGQNSRFDQDSVLRNGHSPVVCGMCEQTDVKLLLSNSLKILWISDVN